uniref:Ras-related protein RABH1b n=1 Tax=Heterorhabditis bacteriophora TaxID=37862 RepID=A0A1I7WXM4_HETBA
MGSYGITEEMMEEVRERGPKNAIIGTYRIVQYQVQTENRQAKKFSFLIFMLQKSDSALPGSSAEERKVAAKPIKNRSKTCSIL